MILRSAIEGGFWGLLVGDAVGVPYEFNDPAKLPAREKIDMIPPSGFKLSGDCPPHGTWSDDGSQALCLLESVLEREKLDVDDFAKRVVRWLREGHLAVDRRVFDVGVQTREAIERIEKGAKPREAGGRRERENGNGSLMRALPLALWHRGTDAQLAEDACDQSLPTHGHVRSQICCAVYCLWARRMLERSPDPWNAAVKTLRDLLPPDSEEREELEDLHPDANAEPGNGKGYVVETLKGARWAVETNARYEDVVRAAISLGWDTDTTACVAGGIAGIRDGVSAIPARWLQALRGREIAEPLLARLLARHTLA